MAELAEIGGFPPLMADSIEMTESIEMADPIILVLHYLSAIFVVLHHLINLICTGPVLILTTVVALPYLKMKFSKPTNAKCQTCQEDFDVDPFNFDQEPERERREQDFVEIVESSDEEMDDEADSGFVGSTQGEISLEINRSNQIQRYTCSLKIHFCAILV